MFVGDEISRHIPESYHKFHIRKFGNLLRSKLIEKWNLIGVQNILDDKELYHKNDKAKHAMDTIVGKNLVPSYPFFLLLILQALEATKPHNLKESSYAYYYDVLIIKSLDKINIKNEEIGAYYNYIAELANLFFENKTHELSNNRIREFNSDYVKRFGDVDPEGEQYVDKLIRASILENAYDVITFRYKFVYYYFIAKYITTNIRKKDIRERISKMAKRLHIEEFARIIMFVTHLSNDPFIMEEIIGNGKKIFMGFSPIKFEDDITPINNLIIEIPKFVLGDKSVKEAREEKYKEDDRKEALSGDNQSEGEFDLDEEIDVNNYMYALNSGLKSIEVMGQILKNHYGLLEIDSKRELGEEAYNIGLRSLKSLFDLFIKDPDIVVNGVKGILERDKIVDHLEIEKESRRILFVLFFIISYFFVEKISSSMGSEHLRETFRKMLQTNNTIAYQLVDISIKLNFFGKFPLRDVEDLLKEIKGKNLPYTLLRAMVINYLYMFPVELRERQRICKLLNITMDVQRKIHRLKAREGGK